VTLANNAIRSTASGHSVARVVYVIEQPAEVEIEEIVIRPTAQDF
jgi:NADP-dependent 3-hydroxy acid dehydrogenase YdfG